MMIDKLKEKNKILKEKLDIAVKALEFYANEDHWFDCRFAHSEEIRREASFF